MKLGASPMLLTSPGETPSYPSIYLDGPDVKALGDYDDVGDTFTATVKVRIASKSQRSGGTPSVSLELIEFTPAPKPDAALSKMYPSSVKG
jgi:hypothetical protein